MPTFFNGNYKEHLINMTKFWILSLIAITSFGCIDNKIEKEVEESCPKLAGKGLGQ